MQRAAAVYVRVWGTVQTGWFTHGLLHVPNNKLSSNMFTLIIAGIRVVTRMIILQKCLNDYMCMIGRKPNLFCSRCGEGH